MIVHLQVHRQTEKEKDWCKVFEVRQLILKAVMYEWGQAINEWAAQLKVQANDFNELERLKLAEVAAKKRVDDLVEMFTGRRPR